MTGVADYILTPHAESEMQQRGIGREVLLQVMAGPEQTADVRPGRVVLQSRVTDAAKVYLVRVFVDTVNQQKS